MEIWQLLCKASTVGRSVQLRLVAWPRKVDEKALQHRSHAKLRPHHLEKLPPHALVFELLAEAQKNQARVGPHVTRIRRFAIGPQLARAPLRPVQAGYEFDPRLKKQPALLPWRLPQPHRQLLETSPHVLLQARLELAHDFVAACLPQQLLLVAGSEHPLEAVEKL